MKFNWIGKTEDGSQVVLKKLNIHDLKFPTYATDSWKTQNTIKINTGAVIDLETTGLSFENDAIIEIGLRQFTYNVETGEILSLEKSYSQFNDPECNISAEITDLTGITNDMVRGHKIDWAVVDQLLSESDIVIAHNASFDRPFLDQWSRASNQAFWGCSASQVNWRAKGLPSGKLEFLNIMHGTFTDSHRALNDAEAVLYVLSFQDPATGRPYLLELIQNASQPSVKIMATHAAFEAKDRLKARRYNWDAGARCWHKTISSSQRQAEIEWLTQSVYEGDFRGTTSEIPVLANFKKSRGS